MILTTVTLRIFFYGLIAFTPNQFQCNGDMRALLIDARNPRHASDGCPIHAHTPALFYRLRDKVKCSDPCTIDRGLCRCDLEDGYLIDIPWKKEIACYRTTTAAKDKPKASKKKNNTCGREDFDYVTKMSSLSPMKDRMRLRTECNQACPTVNQVTRETNSICKLVAAQVNFKAKSVSSCRWATDSNGEVRQFALRPLSSSNVWSPRPSILPEVLLFTTELETKDESPRTIDLEVISFDGNELYTLAIPVTSKNGMMYSELSIVNFMDDDDHDNSYPGCSSRSVARDFEIYHDLVRRPMYVYDQAIPHVHDQSSILFPGADLNKSITDKAIVPPDCESDLMNLLLTSILSAGKSRPICPETSIDQ